MSNFAENFHWTIGHVKQQNILYCTLLIFLAGIRNAQNLLLQTF